MKIVYTGPLVPGDTCELRRRALERLGHETMPIDYLPIVHRQGPLSRRVQWRLRLGSMVREYTDALLRALETAPDVLWVDKGLFVVPAVLAAARRRGVRWLVHYSPDNYALPGNASRHLWRGLGAYDVVVTTKQANVALLRAAGARRVVLSGNAFDPVLHRPVTPATAEQAALAADVSFIGRWEPLRELTLSALTALPVRLRVRGPGWERVRNRALRAACEPGPVYGEAYVQAIAAAKVNLGLLSRDAGDTITQRSVEIPACGAFLLAERTADHQAHFVEGEEAAYFDGTAELARSIMRWVRDDDGRRRIAAAGRARCLASGYAYDDRLRAILEALVQATTVAGDASRAA
jgi:spore maturation protein CgeB